MIIHPDANVRGLATAVIMNAVSDMTSRDDLTAVLALLWFYSDDYLFWAGLCDVTTVPKFDPDKKVMAKVKGQRRKVYLNAKVREILKKM